MNWDEAKSMIGSIAPTVMAAIGAVVPVPGGAAIGGLAGKVLQQVLGTNQPDKILEVINQDPNIAFKLREAELSFQIETQRIEKDKYALQLLDVQNARLREVSLAQIGKSDFTFYSVGWIVTLGFFACVVLLIFFPEQITNTSILNVITTMLGYLAGAFTTVVSYFYGSSKSSADNKGMMAILQDKLIPPGK